MFNSNFNKNIFKMFTGNVIGTVITFATLPILTRIYTQEDFGNFQLLISLIALLASVSSLKYEMAIVLPKKDKDADKVITISLLILISYIVLLSLLFTLLGEEIFHLLNISSITNPGLIIIIGIFVTGVYQISVNIIVRKNEFGLLANNGIIRPAISNGGGIVLGLIKSNFTGLYISQILSQVVITLMNFKKANFSFIGLPFKNLNEVLKKYKKLALINSPLEFLNTYSIQLPVLLIGAYFGAGALGIYMIADRLLNTPLRVIGQSFQKVYYKEAADAYQQDKSELLIIFKSTVKKLAIIGLLPLVIVLVAAPIAVQLVLGDSWSEAGVYMQILMIGYYFRFINSPVSNTFIIIKKQEIGLIIVIVSVLVRWGFMVLFSETIYTMLFALMISTAMFYIIYNFLIYYYIKKEEKNIV